jgi:hypothetical protein
MSEAAAKAGLSNTLFERLQGSLGPAASCMLTVQYRMNAAIMDWSSQELYGVSADLLLLLLLLICGVAAADPACVQLIRGRACCLSCMAWLCVLLGLQMLPCV